MKKILFPLVASGFLAACHKQPLTVVPKETERTKKTTFRVFLNEDYSSAAYDSTYASVELALYKETLKDGSQMVVWDTILNRQRLKLYPTILQPLIVTKTVTGMYENQQRLRVSTTTKYDNRGANQFSSHLIPYTYGLDSLLVDVRL